MSDFIIVIKVILWIFVPLSLWYLLFKSFNKKMINDSKYKSENPESEKKQEKLNLEVLYCDRCHRRVEHKRVYTGEKTEEVGNILSYEKDAFRLYCGNCGRESLPLLESVVQYKNMKLRRSDKPVIKYSQENLKNYSNLSAREKFRKFKDKEEVN